MAMSSTKQPLHAEPAWWTAQHSRIWKQHLPALRSVFAQRVGEQNRRRIASQGPDDALIQGKATTPRNVEVEHAHGVADSWEASTTWEQIAPGLRYGVGARAHYPQHTTWTPELQTLLRSEWCKLNEPSTWEKVKRAVRQGFEFSPN
jgi:hypothetical protein